MAKRLTVATRFEPLIFFLRRMPWADKNAAVIEIVATPIFYALMKAQFNAEMRRVYILTNTQF